MTEAIQSDRNSDSPNGDQGETERFEAIGSITGILIISAMKDSSTNREHASRQRTTKSERPAND
jgi:hypothetical protein